MIEARPSALTVLSRDNSKACLHTHPSTERVSGGHPELCLVSVVATRSRRAEDDSRGRQPGECSGVAADVPHSRLCAEIEGVARAACVVESPAKTDRKGEIPSGR